MRTGKFLAALAATASIMAPVEQAFACWDNPKISYNLVPASLKRDFFSEWSTAQDCLEVSTDMQGYLTDVRAGRVPLAEAMSTASNFEDGPPGCSKDRVFARRIFDAVIGRPARAEADQRALFNTLNFINRNPGLYSDKRLDDVWGRYWLNADYPQLTLTPDWEKDQYRELINRPGNWEQSLARYRENGPRDEIIYGMLTDPGNPRFNPATAVKWTEKRGLAEEVRVAGALLDHGTGVEQRQLAQRLLDWYSPYVHRPAGSAEQVEQAKALWVKIATRLAESDDPDERARGKAILSTGDPHRGAEMLLPQVEGLVVLDRRPDSFPEFRLREATMVDAYPARAIRASRGGLVSTSLLFGPDGKFQKIWVTQSSGTEALDKATVDSFQRYVRPKPSELTLAGYAGQSVLVPLPDIEWHWSSDSNYPDGAKWVDGRLAITSSYHNNTVC